MEGNIVLWQPHVRNHRLTIAWVKYQTTEGLNSKLEDGNHVLMWDFDGYGFDIVRDGLINAQRIYKLSTVYLFGTKPPDHYHALCLTRHSLIETIHIITSIPIVDPQWLRGGCVRQYFTLRIGRKNGHYPKAIKIFRSKVKPDVKIDDLKYFDRYETIDR
jgi:hypothetical protein